MLINGSAISRVDAPGLQLILAARIIYHNQTIHWQWQGASSALMNAAKRWGGIS
ncbi:hypothetical protein [Candidatus Enterovibrio altilux]|uniref:hypothetical protein n=1 Tax=Candidatus Enterovibrio altilux TaxID=1927128 RepID=UPI001CC26B19|nr:hypothetical protein [Candidatus Enterovibrio luxaltus]